MPDKSALENYYGTLTDQQLLQLHSEGGFTAEAECVLSIELAQRHLGSRDVSKHVAAAERSKLRDEVVERGGGYTLKDNSGYEQSPYSRLWAMVVRCGGANSSWVP